jgi:outer membrane receptor protein involved in Fe transport
MFLRLKLGLLTFGLLLTVAARSQEQGPEVEHYLAPPEVITIGVMEFKGVGLPQETADVIADVIAEHITKLGDVRVVSKADITALLNLEKQRRLAGCTDRECFAEVAGALGMPWMVTGSVSILGKSAILNLKLIDVRSAYVAGRATRRIQGDVEDLLYEVPGAVEALFEKVGDRFGFALGAHEVKSASKHRQSIFWSPSSVTVFTREDIRYAGVTRLADLLRRVPGFDIYQMKSSWPLVGARALTDESNNLVLVLVDGRETLVELAGFTIWTGLAIDLEEVERIEVIRGPGSTLYGANAFAGIINITTVAEKPQSTADVFIKGGEFNNYRLYGRARQGWELGDGWLSFNLSTGGWGKHSVSDPSDMILAVPLRIHSCLRYHETTDLDLSLHAGYAMGDGVFFVHVGDMRIANASTLWSMAKAAFSLGDKARLKMQFYHIRFKTSFYYRTEFYAYDIWVADLPDLLGITSTLDGQVQLDLEIFDDLNFVGGFNARYSFMSGENFYVTDDDELRLAVFAHLQWALWENLQLTGGLRLDASKAIDEFKYMLSPRAVAVLRPWEKHAFRLGYALAFRKPSFYENRIHFEVDNFNPAVPEVVDKMKTSLGNEELVNERVHSFEAGWQARLVEDRLKLSLDLFYNIYQDVIYFESDIKERLGVPDIANSIFHFENQKDDIHAVGGEVEVGWKIGDAWRVWANLGLRKVTDAETDEDLPGEPHCRINFGGRYLPSDGWVLDLSMHYVSAYKMPLRDPTDPMAEPELMSLGGNLLLLVRAAYRVKLNETSEVETGLFIRTPLGGPFREYAGVEMPLTPRTDTLADFGGEKLVRLLSLYLRGSF